MKRRSGRLALRIWLVGIAQIASQVLLFLLFGWIHSSSAAAVSTPDAHTRYVLDRLVDAAQHTPAGFIAAVEDARRVALVDVWVLDGEGNYLAGSPPPRDCPEPPPLARAPPPGPCLEQIVERPDGAPTTITVRMGGRLPSPFLGMIALVVGVLIVVVSGSLLARSVTRPLERLSAAAYAFGRGDRGARARLQRTDELGEVARAFDDMADRITTLLRTERELLANVSHELRTPLARIRVALELATEADVANLHESLHEVAIDLGELEGIIADVLTAARLDPDDAPPSNGIPPLHTAPTAVDELIEQAASRFQGLYPERELRVNVEVGLADVNVDRVLLRRAFDNLLENAHKYTREPQLPIELRAFQLDGCVHVTVADQGVGIAEEDLGRVFDPFFRVDRSRTRSTGGLGLGLSLAKRIVEAHHGYITIRSAPGSGTTVTVALPVAVEASTTERLQKSGSGEAVR